MQELSTSLLQLKKKKTQRNLPRKIASTLNISKYCVLFYTFFWLYYYLNLRFFGMFDLKLRLSQYFILQTLYVKMAFFDERLLFIEVCACIQYLCIHDSSNLTHTHSLSPILPYQFFKKILKFNFIIFFIECKQEKNYLHLNIHIKHSKVKKERAQVKLLPGIERKRYSRGERST